MKMTQITYLNFLEEDIQGIYKKLNQNCIEDGFFSRGGGKKIYEESEKFRNLVNELEKVQQEMLPVVLDIYRKSLALKSELLQSKVTD